MKIVVSIPNDQRTKLSTFLEGISNLKKLGHNVFETYDHESKSFKDFDKIDKAIKDTDILISEVTEADSKVGYEIARALDEKKVVIALEEEGNTSKLPIIHDNNSRTLIHIKYSDDKVSESLNKALKEAESKLDSKFILIISPEIDRYLEWAGQTRRMHKAQIVRTAVEQMIKKDKDYKTYIQG